jgi:hypothetical protein
MNSYQNREKLRNSSYKEIDLETRPFDCIVLPNNSILFSNRDDKKLTLCDENFKCIKTVDKFDEKSFYPEAVAFDGQNRIYITNRDSHDVILTDLNLNKIKSFGSIGNGRDQFDDPCGICYINGLVYICDTKNERVKILNASLEYHDSVGLEFEPWLIKGSSNLVCIERNDGKGISFYNLNDNFNLVFNYSHGWGKISMINSCFYECCVKSRRVYCYDENGFLIEDINIDRLEFVLSNSWDGYLFCFKNNLSMLCYNKRRIIQFE